MKSQNQTSPSEKSFLRTILLLLLCGSIFLSGLTGTLYVLDKQGKLDSFRHTSNRSTSDQTGKYYLGTDEQTDSSPAASETTIAPDTESSSDFDPVSTDPDVTADSTPDAQEGDLYGYTIILDAGHGGRDTGAVFPFNSPTYHECDFNLRIAKEVQAELESRGAEVYMLRTDDSWVSLYGRVAQAHLICLDIAEREEKLPFSETRADELREMLQTVVNLNDDSVELGGMGPMVGSGVGEDLEDLFEMEYQLDHVLFLSIHLNSSEKRTLHGTQIFYVTDESVIESERHLMKTSSDFKRPDFPIREEYYGRHNEDNELLACCMYDNIVGNIPKFATNAHPVNADNYAVLREHGLTGVLIEVAYLSDDNDRTMLEQDEYVKRVAHSIGDGCVMYFAEKGV